mmetsp:Transcript_10588/g.14950  ORF Transcript_10588/g.14950 Transcript_10588/m.14950 type:complete len:96 (+) Transcript_10588:314-601(+)
MMMMLPGGSYAVLPVCLGEAPKENALEEGDTKKRIIEAKGAPFQTEFGVFFASEDASDSKGENHLVRTVRVYRENGRLSSCLHTHHTWANAVEEP